MTDAPKRKRRILRSLRVEEISAVDKAAQVPAEAVLMKSAEPQPRGEPMTKLNEIQDAERVAKSGGTPGYTRHQYEDAMMRLAKSEARPGESTACAFARLCDEDERMQKLYGAGQQADIRKSEREAHELIAKNQAELWPLMVKVARDRARPGETVEQAMDRLLCTDPLFKRCYATMS